MPLVVPKFNSVKFGKGVGGTLSFMFYLLIIYIGCLGHGFMLTGEMVTAVLVPDLYFNTQNICNLAVL